MSESPENNNRSATTSSFYSKQRGHICAETAAPSIASTDASMKGTNSAISSLDAFLLSQEEDAFALLATFTQLTEQDKMRVLAEVEGEADSSDTESTAPGVKKVAKPVAHYEALRRRLQAQERQCQRDRQVDQQRHVDAASMGGGACSSAVADVHSDVDALETVELTDGTHTGNLVAFFDRGVVDVSTSFDNFFGGDGEVMAAIANAASKENGDARRADTAPQQARVRETALPTLDEILALDDIDEIAAHVSAAHEHSGDDKGGSEECITGEAPDAEYGEKDAELRSSASSSSSEMGSVELPGLDDTVVSGPQNGNAAPPAFGTNERSMLEIDSELVADLRQVVVEQDDCVQTFALDPLFDYDADVLGEAFRMERAWRQS